MPKHVSKEENTSGKASALLKIANSNLGSAVLASVLTVFIFSYFQQPITQNAIAHYQDEWDKSTVAADFSIPLTQPDHAIVG